MDNESKRRLRHMLQEEDNNIDLDIYGLGTVRSHHDYEIYAGINFAKRKLHPDAIKGLNPPTTDDIDHSWIYDIEIDNNLKLDWTSRWNDIRNQTSCTCTFQFIYLGVEDNNGNVLFRQDLTDNNYLLGINTNITVDFKSLTKPYKLVIWPYDKEKEWLNRIDINL
jgi:hypothetical protein